MSVGPPQPLYLNEGPREVAPIGLAGAARAAMRMADVLEAMLRYTLDAPDKNDRDQVDAPKRLDAVLRLSRTTEEYLTLLDPETFDGPDSDRLSEISAFVPSVEHAGRFFDKGLIGVATKRLIEREAGGDPIASICRWATY